MKLLYRNLIYYRQLNLYAGLAAGVCIAIITGALIIGSTLRHNLWESAHDRLGFVQSVINSPTSSFSATISDEIASSLRDLDISPSDISIVPVKILNATAINPEIETRVNLVQMIGIDNNLAQTSGISSLETPGINEAIINSETARRLSLNVGDDIVLQFPAENMASELALYSGEDNTRYWRVTVSEIADNKHFGAFSLKNDQKPVCNIFLDANQLANKLETSAGYNTLLLGYNNDNNRDQIEKLIIDNLSLADLGYIVGDNNNNLTLKYRGVFINNDITDAITQLNDKIKPFSGYLINNITNNSNDLTSSYCFSGTSISELDDNSVIINDWLANDIKAIVGDMLVLDYFEPADNNELKTAQISLKISKIVPVDSISYMQDLMPEIPGMTDSTSCSNWQAGIPVDMDKISDSDEDYWEQYRMTPRVILSYQTAKRLFAARYGIATSLTGDITTTDNTQKNIRDTILSIDRPRIIRADANADFSVNNSMDFGGLFLSLSMFLIASALLLPAMLFGLNIESRKVEIASLLALGYSKRSLLQLFMIEIAIVSIIGGVCGIFLGWLYAWGLNIGLSGIFSGAIANYGLKLHIDSQSIITGYVSTLIMVIGASIYKCRKIMNNNIRSAFSIAPPLMTVNIRNGKISLILGLTIVISAVLYALTGKSGVMTFFVGGSGLLCGSIFLCKYLLSLNWIGRQLTTSTIAWNNLTRNQGSTLSVIISLACGVFLILAVGLNHYNPMADIDKNTGPTGGFDTMAKCSVPVTETVKSDSGHYLAFREHGGDDASCLNLNRPVTPGIIGVNVDDIARHAPFSFAKTATSKQDWRMLTADDESEYIPAVTDYNTIMWALHKSVGDIIEVTDQQGKSVKLKLYAGMKNSILQGKLIIDEKAFKMLYPNDNGYKLVLFDRADKQLADILNEHGSELRDTVDVIGELYRVENTYMTMFALLGGLGLIMGNIVLGVTLLRNVQSRKREFALMNAIGFSSTDISRIIRKGYLLPIIVALVIGIGSAVFGVSHQLATNISNLPVFMVSLIVLGVMASALIAVEFACYSAKRNNTLATLKNK